MRTIEEGMPGGAHGNQEVYKSRNDGRNGYVSESQQRWHISHLTRISAYVATGITQMWILVLGPSTYIVCLAG